jgi:hypothetical protein
MRAGSPLSSMLKTLTDDAWAASRAAPNAFSASAPNTTNLRR